MVVWAERLETEHADRTPPDQQVMEAAFQE